MSCRRLFWGDTLYNIQGDIPCNILYNILCDNTDIILGIIPGFIMYIITDFILGVIPGKVYVIQTDSYGRSCRARASGRISVHLRRTNATRANAGASYRIFVQDGPCTTAALGRMYMRHSFGRISRRDLLWINGLAFSRRFLKF